MGEKLHQLKNEIIRVGVESEFLDLKDLEGDFWPIRTEVDCETLQAIDRAGLTCPEFDEVRLGTYLVKDFLISTTSTVVTIQSEKADTDEDGLVLKVLREPRWRFKGDQDENRIFSDNLGHFLFPWGGQLVGGGYDDLELGIEFQRACLLGELRAGVWHNNKADPYLGLVGVKDVGGGRIELSKLKETSVKNKIWPALVMKQEKLDYNVARIVYEWNQDPNTWPDLNHNDIIELVFNAVKAYTDKAIPVTDNLGDRFGDLDFFRRCLLFETPAQAAGMGKDQAVIKGKGAAELRVINKAADSAKRSIEVMGSFLEKNSDYINEEVVNRLVIGHADSKLSNTCIQANTKEEVTEMIKAGQTALVLLDAHSLAVKPHMMYQQKGIQYAHWRIVPNEQQWAYALMQLIGMGLTDIHDEIYSKLKKESGFNYKNGLIDDYWYKIQLLYKMVGVEPFVNSFGFQADQTNGLMNLTMRVYPEVGHGLINEINNWLSN